MKARKPKAWAELRDSDKEAIKGYMIEVCEKTVDKDARIILDLYIKMVCVVLHDAFGFGEKRLNYFLGNHRRLFQRQCKLVRDDKQIAYLEKRMNEIFRKNGFPKDFFDQMLGGTDNGYAIFGEEGGGNG